MMKLIKKIVVFLCATLIAVCGFGCADGSQQPDANKPLAEQALATIQAGEYVDGTTIGEWTFEETGWATKIIVTVDDDVLSIEIVEGTASGQTVQAFTYHRTNTLYYVFTTGATPQFDKVDELFIGIEEKVFSLVSTSED